MVGAVHCPVVMGRERSDAGRERISLRVVRRKRPPHLVGAMYRSLDRNMTNNCINPQSL